MTNEDSCSTSDASVEPMRSGRCGVVNSDGLVVTAIESVVAVMVVVVAWWVVWWGWRNRLRIWVSLSVLLTLVMWRSL